MRTCLNMIRKCQVLAPLALPRNHLLAVGFQCYTISIILHTLLWAPFHRSLRSGHTPYCTDLREQNPQWKDNCVPGSNVTVKNAKVSP
jgi:hypothetical protein